MDVVAVIPSLRAGGAERVLLSLARLLAESGRSVRVVAIDPDGPLDPCGEVILTSLDRRRVRRAVPALLRTIRSDRPSVVLASETHLNVALCLLRPFLPRATHLIVRESRTLTGSGPTDGTGALRLIRGRAYRLADLVLATSPPMAAELRRAGVRRIELLPNPVDVTALRDAAGRDMSDRPPSSGRAFAAVGRLVPVKAFDDLIAAFRDGAGPDDRLDLVGDGPERPRLRALAGIDPRIVFHGHVEAPAAIVAAADALVMSSRSEGMPNAVLESLALGTPVIAVDELDSLVPLADEIGPAALRLVPRARLGAELATIRADLTPRPRPSLLPPRFERERVGAELERLIAAT